MKHKIICQNRRARYEYEIHETLECGIVLVGLEVKSLVVGQASIEEAYAIVEKGEVWLINSHIQGDNPTRRRKLLLNKKEIAKFAEKSVNKGFTLIPLSMYFKNKAKVELAVCRGRKKFDKRQAEKEKEAKKEISGL